MDPQTTAPSDQTSENLVDINGHEDETSFFYPLGTSPLTHIVFGSYLGEISNAYPISQSFPLTRRPRHMPRKEFLALPPRLQPYMFTLYQTGMHGPQNGWKLVCVEEGNDPIAVEKYLEGMGGIERNSKGMIIFRSLQPREEAGADVVDTAETDCNVLLLDDSPEDYARIIAHLLHSAALPVLSLSNEDAVRLLLARPAGPFDRFPPQNSNELRIDQHAEAELVTDRAALFALADDRTTGNRMSGSTDLDERHNRYLVLVKEGHHPSFVQDRCRELLDSQISPGSFIIFGTPERQEGLIVYNAQGQLSHTL